MALKRPKKCRDCGEVFWTYSNNLMDRCEDCYWEMRECKDCHHTFKVTLSGIGSGRRRYCNACTTYEACHARRKKSYDCSSEEKTCSDCSMAFRAKQGNRRKRCYDCFPPRNNQTQPFLENQPRPNQESHPTSSSEEIAYSSASEIPSNPLSRPTVSAYSFESSYGSQNPQYSRSTYGTSTQHPPSGYGHSPLLSSLEPYYPCLHEGCEIAFNNADDLTKHMGKSHGPAYFPCMHAGCEAAFRYAVHLKDHMKKHHSTFGRHQGMSIPALVNRSLTDCKDFHRILTLLYTNLVILLITDVQIGWKWWAVEGTIAGIVCSFFGSMICMRIDEATSLHILVTSHAGCT